MKLSKKSTRAALATGIMLSALFATSAHAQEVRKPDGLFLPKPRMDQKQMVPPGAGLGMSIQFEAIHKALDSGDYAAFSSALTAAGIKETVSEANFRILVDALAKAKSGDIAGAQSLLKTNNIAPMLNRFIMANHIELTDAQKNALKEAALLSKEGNTAEAKVVLESAGLPSLPKTEPNTRPAELKTALDTAKTLRAEGKQDEAAQVLKDAGISDKAIEKIQSEFDKEKPAPKTTVLQKIKNFFKFGKK